MHTMFPTLLENTPELEACAQLKNLHTSFLPMCKLPTLPHSTNLFYKNPAVDGFPPLKYMRSRTISIWTHMHQHTLSKIWKVITLAWPVVMVPGPVHQWAWNNISFHSCSPASSDTEKCFYLFYLFYSAHIDPLLSGTYQRPQCSFTQYQSSWICHWVCASFFCVYLHDNNFLQNSTDSKRHASTNTGLLLWHQTLRSERAFSPSFSTKTVAWKDSRF